MLLMNRTLLKMAKGLWGWIFAIAALKLAALAGTAVFAGTVSSFLGKLSSPELAAGETKAAVVSAFFAAAAVLAADLLTGEAEFRCTAKARQNLRTGIFSKALELDVGNIEKIGPVSAITSSVDGVESMQIYYSRYLPGLIYCMIAPVYLFFQLKGYSLPAAALLFLVSFLLLPVNNVFRKHIEALKTEYWNSMEDLTGYYLESIQGLTALKLFGRDEDRTRVLREKAGRFNQKIMDVMRFFDPDASDGELWEALEQAMLKDWAEAQPDKLNTDVGDAGGKLSGGQRQKIGIARALLSRAEYIIFDEATSSVDIQSEQEIWNCIDRLSKTRTLIVISHRLSTIRNADQICILENGRIAARGDHEYLMSRSGLYRRLVEEQEALERSGEEGVIHG